MKKKLGLTRGEVDTAIDRAIDSCRIYRDRETVRFCQTGVVQLQRIMRREGPTVPGKLTLAVRIANGACRALMADEADVSFCRRGVAFATEEIKRQSPGISGCRMGILDIDRAIRAAGEVHRDCAELHHDPKTREFCQTAAASVAEAVIARGVDLDVAVKLEMRDCARKSDRRMDTIACQQGADFMRTRLKRSGISGRHRS